MDLKIRRMEKKIEVKHWLRQTDRGLPPSPKFDKVASEKNVASEFPHLGQDWDEVS